MLRPILVAGAAALALTATGCGLRPAATGSPLGDYTNSDAILAASVGTGAGSPAAAAEGCGHSKGYGGLVLLTSADTQKSVGAIVDELRAGHSLDTVAGSSDATVKQQANATVKVVLDAGVANARITSAQEQQLLPLASSLIDMAMGADVSACISAVGTGAGR